MRRRIYEDLLRQQREYEARMQKEWETGATNSQAYYHMEDLYYEEQKRRFTRKFFYFLATFTAMTIFFNLIFSIFRSPGPQYVATDPTTGQKYYVSAEELASLNMRARERGRGVDRERQEYLSRGAQDRELERNIGRMVAQQQKEREKKRKEVEKDRERGLQGGMGGQGGGY